MKVHGRGGILTVKVHGREGILTESSWQGGDSK